MKNFVQVIEATFTIHNTQETSSQEPHKSNDSD